MVSTAHDHGHPGVRCHRHLEAAAEAFRLRAALDDLVALSAIHVGWAGMQPRAVAAGLADALVSLLQLDYAFVRLSDPGGAGAVEVTRGRTWGSSPKWLKGRLVDSTSFPRQYLGTGFADEERSRGFAVPVGERGEGGMIAAASQRSDFPTSTDQLLLSLAANHAAAAFESACRIDARKQIEHELREIKDKLEATAAERTSELSVANDELTALRRVATLVAGGIEPKDLFAVVADEVGRLFGTDAAAVVKFDHDDPGLVLVGISTGVAWILPIGMRWHVDDALASAEVYRTGRSARVDMIDESSHGGEVVDSAKRLTVVSSVASPIVVAGRLWGAVSVSSSEARLPTGLEERVEKFTELVATAVANADSRSELAASRRRIVAASDEARRRIERDLHDGTQQRLVSVRMAVRAAEAGVPRDCVEVRAELSRIATELADAVEELQEISRGIHPPVLSEGGLGPALRALARRSPIPVELDVTMTTRFPEPIEVAAYYVASEAFANAAKHAQASRIEVRLAQRTGGLVLSIRDDGIGGADQANGSGLVGLTDRVEALGGSMQVESRFPGGTSVTASLPLPPGAGRNP